MKVKVYKNFEELGKNAAVFAARILNQAIREKNNARLLLSTGASQFDALKALTAEDIDWSKVEMFHLDEYVGLADTHPASFRKYLKDRFINVVGLQNYHLIKTEGDLEKNIQALTKEVRKAPIDLAFIGIGENAHIAFNDPPADFDTKDAYIVVNLNEKCKMQQVNEGWFATAAVVPQKAVSMTVYQIMQSKAIISCVPYKAKAEAVKFTLEQEIQNLYPATMLRKHNNVVLFLDEESASLIDPKILRNFQ
jgi:glucosamine-6-phosphate deaminase